MANTGIAQAIIDVLLVGLHALADGRLHVDLEQHVNAATQIETEAHRVEPQ